MPRYVVPMFGTSAATARVVVEAESPWRARAQAELDVRNGEIDVEWQYDNVDALYAGEPEELPAEPHRQQWWAAPEIGTPLTTVREAMERELASVVALELRDVNNVAIAPRVAFAGWNADHQFEIDRDCGSGSELAYVACLNADGRAVTIISPRFDHPFAQRGQLARVRIGREA